MPHKWFGNDLKVGRNIDIEYVFHDGPHGHCCGADQIPTYIITLKRKVDGKTVTQMRLSLTNDQHDSLVSGRFESDTLTCFRGDETSSYSYGRSGDTGDLTVRLKSGESTCDFTIEDKYVNDVLVFINRG
jgi:hypothetical protein